MYLNTTKKPYLSHAVIPPQHTGVARAILAPDVSERTEASILLIDDDPAVRESLCRVLTADGWQVITAESGEEALECLRENEPDLMITDLCMECVSGWDLLFHERIQRPHLPIFVITGLSNQATNRAAQLATEFFLKPVDPEVLLAAVRRYLEGYSDGFPSSVWPQRPK